MIGIASRRPAAAALAALLTFGWLAAAPRARAEEPSPQRPNSGPEELLRDTIEQLVEALGQVLQDVPRYAPPQLDRNGNIILRRLNPPPVRPAAPPGWTLDQTST